MLYLINFLLWFSFIQIQVFIKRIIFIYLTIKFDIVKISNVVEMSLVVTVFYPCFKELVFVSDNICKKLMNIFLSFLKPILNSLKKNSYLIDVFTFLKAHCKSLDQVVSIEYHIK